MKAIYNTKESGILHFLIFKQGTDDYTAVCINLDLVEYGKDPKALERSISEAAKSYINSVRAKKLSDEYLNKPTDNKYLEMLRGIEFENIKNKPKRIKSHKPQALITRSERYSPNSASL